MKIAPAVPPFSWRGVARQGLCVTGVGLSDGMLESARLRLAGFAMNHLDLRMMDARTLDFPGASFKVVYLFLILIVVAEGARVLAEAA